MGKKGGRKEKKRPAAACIVEKLSPMNQLGSKYHLTLGFLFFLLLFFFNLQGSIFGATHVQQQVN